MTDSTYPLFPIAAFLGFILPLIPLPWHLQALNSSTCYFIFWSSLACLNQFVNSVVWAGNALNPAPIWCEISIRIMMAASVGIPASSLCINRRLYGIATIQAPSITPAEKCRTILVDSLICLLFPLVFVALQYIVQGHRFNIFEDIGCYPALYNTLLTFFISSMWPLGLGLISIIYCTLTLRSFIRRRAEFSRFISSKTTLTVSHYFRLMALAMAEICATTPLSVFTIWLNATATPIGPWRSWQDTHLDYSRVVQVPAVLWRANHILVIAMEFSRWVTPVCSFTFFAFFGFAHESRRNYALAWNWLKKRSGIASAVSKLRSKDRRLKLNPSRSCDKHAIDLNAGELPLHISKRQPSFVSSISTLPNDKPTYSDPYSPSPQSSAVIQIPPLTATYPPFVNSPSVKLTRSQTL